ncbi:phage major capsid protein [Sphingomonas phyllosphaerae]|uniref:phage major capsid protein n=1 Tax=Sphingomonas phyllosphaerae TaxID=257003 RepID=UPI0018CA2005|nr:phage major capsid protein [Sphingomonas phyllosphaerae]
MLPGLGKVIRDPAFVAEGQPIPAVTGNFAGATLGPQRKLAAITGISGDLAQYSAENALDVIEMAMRDAAASALDAALFSDAAGSDARPAGLLAGVSPIAAASGGPADAMVADLAGLAGAISAAGGGTGILYFANPRQEVAVRLRSAAFADVIVPTPRLAPGTVVAVETNAIASAFDGLPQVDVATATAIHWEDTNPAQIATAGSPNAVAAPVTSIFQTAGFALRLILRCAWASRMPGAVQMVTGAAW